MFARLALTQIDSLGKVQGLVLNPHLHDFSIHCIAQVGGAVGLFNWLLKFVSSACSGVMRVFNCLPRTSLQSVCGTTLLSRQHSTL
jgi:hypothetical protein